MKLLLGTVVARLDARNRIATFIEKLAHCKNLSSKSAPLIPTELTSTFHLTNVFLFSRHHIPTNSVAPLSAYKLTHNPQFLQSLWRRANAQNVSFFTLYGGQFTFSTELWTLNYLLYSSTDAAPLFLEKLTPFIHLNDWRTPTGQNNHF